MQSDQQQTTCLPHPPPLLVQAFVLVVPVYQPHQHVELLLLLMIMMELVMVMVMQQCHQFRVQG